MVSGALARTTHYARSTIGIHVRGVAPHCLLPPQRRLLARALGPGVAWAKGTVRQGERATLACYRLVLEVTLQFAVSAKCQYAATFTWT